MTARRGTGGSAAGRPSPVARPASGAVALGLLALLLAPAATLEAQSLAQRVARAEAETVRFSFPTRPDVLICDEGIRMGEDHHVRWRSGGWGDDWATNCRPGPAEVELRLRDGRVRDLELLDRRRGARSGGVALGTVGAREAVDYLLELARDGRGEVAEDAVFPVVLADVDRVWEPLLELARDGSARSGARKSALFWLGQEAAEAATEGLVSVAGDDDEEQDVRDAAIFALSQRPDHESVPALMELARTADRAETRRSALFWLAQSDDPQVVEFFAEILRGSGAR